jgi:hypothetical protein
MKTKRCQSVSAPRVNRWANTHTEQHATHPLGCGYNDPYRPIAPSLEKKDVLDVFSIKTGRQGVHTV